MACPSGRSGQAVSCFQTDKVTVTSCSQFRAGREAAAPRACIQTGSTRKEQIADKERVTE